MCSLQPAELLRKVPQSTALLHSLDLAHSFFLGTESELTALRLVFPDTTSERNKVCVPSNGGHIVFFLDIQHKDGVTLGCRATDGEALALVRPCAHSLWQRRCVSQQLGSVRERWRREVPTTICAASLSLPGSHGDPSAPTKDLLHMCIGKALFSDNYTSPLAAKAQTRLTFSRFKVGSIATWYVQPHTLFLALVTRWEAEGDIFIWSFLMFWEQRV